MGFSSLRNYFQTENIKVFIHGKVIGRERFFVLLTSTNIEINASEILFQIIMFLILLAFPLSVIVVFLVLKKVITN
jgi:hypothetical protein